MTQKAVVVLSGGQDSITCLGLALRLHEPEDLYAITFDYGQRHRVEIEAATTVCRTYRVEQKIVQLGFLPDIVTSALVGDGEVGLPHPTMKNVPSSFVPNRNALFLTIAHAYAQEKGASSLWTGVCETDYSGYPDCREVFINQLEKALNTGYLSDIAIVTPLMHVGKARTFAIAEETGVLRDVILQSRTCYNGSDTFNEWGYGCGTCPSCELRKKGWFEYLAGRQPLPTPSFTHER